VRFLAARLLAARLPGRSLAAQFTVRFAAIYAVTIIVSGFVFAYFADRSESLETSENLTRYAKYYANAVRLDPDGRVHLDPPDHADNDGRCDSGGLVAIHQSDGTLLFASSAEIAGLANDWIKTGTNAGVPHPLGIQHTGTKPICYSAVVTTIASAAGPLSIVVAQPTGLPRLAWGPLWRWARFITWILALFAIPSLAMGVVSIRRGLRPVRAASERAALIQPGVAEVRLPVEKLPSELLPLVGAVNLALHRMEQGFVMQRQFTANAAHELRTPLAILTAGLDELNDTIEVEKLRADAARMNRVVDQLLRIARLDAAPLDLSIQFDLTAVAAEVTSYLAPWAIAQNRMLGFESPEAPVLVRGNPGAVGDAVRNLVENAVRHAPPETETTVSVGPEGMVVVWDRGPGVPAADRERIFERFWRGRTVRSAGAGLGLAIVAEVARLHGGRIEVADAPGGGAMFSLQLRLVH
jgi:signal transduction histidine kinase